jgi:hypothetical protein
LIQHQELPEVLDARMAERGIDKERCAAQRGGADPARSAAQASI